MGGSVEAITSLASTKWDSPTDGAIRLIRNRRRRGWRADPLFLLGKYDKAITDLQEAHGWLVVYGCHRVAGPREVAERNRKWKRLRRRADGARSRYGGEAGSGCRSGVCEFASAAKLEAPKNAKPEAQKGNSADETTGVVATAIRSTPVTETPAAERTAPLHP